MNELLNHLYEDNLPSLYWSETTQRIEYSEMTRDTYMMIARAIREGADSIEAAHLSLSWSKGGKVLHRFDSDLPKLYPGKLTPEHSFANQIRKILAKDPIMKKWTRVVKDTDDQIVCEVVSLSS